MLMIVKKNRKVKEYCDSIIDDIKEIGLTLDEIKKCKDDIDILFHVDYINDCLVEINEHIVKLQSKFTTSDEEFLSIVTKMEIEYDNRNMKTLELETFNLLKYICK